MKILFISLVFLLPLFCFSQTVNLRNMAQFSAYTGAKHFNNWITDHTKVPNSDQTNFPVLVSLTNTALKYFVNGGNVANSSGFDITFATDSLGASPLNWEVESYNNSTGNIIAWVKLPTLHHSTNDTIYIRYGDSSKHTFQGNVTGTWNTAYTAVWHMAQTLTGSGQTVNDATSNALNLSSNGVWTSGQQALGQVGGSLSLLNTSSDYLSFTSTATGSTYTLEGWYNTSTADGTAVAFGTNTGSPGVNINWFGGVAQMYNGSTVLIQDSTSTTANVWTHIVFTVNGTAMIAYHNGVKTSTSANGTSQTYLNLGKAGPFFTSNMIFDEIRMSNVVRSADWIGAEYANMNSPSTFGTLGSQH